jgi:hypothetical protein
MFVATNVDSAEVVAFLPIPFVVGGLFWVAAWVHYRAINRDMPLSSYQRKLMRYWTWFVIGCGYALIFPAIFREPKKLGVLLCLVWALTLWTVHRRRHERLTPNEPEIARKMAGSNES